mgnify:CR=1 FL=1
MPAASQKLHHGAEHGAHELDEQRLVARALVQAEGAREGASQTPLCHTCHVVRPLRSKHCVISKRCVSTFDHFCPYIGNTIGGGNYIWFLALIFCGVFEIAGSAAIQATLEGKRAPGDFALMGGFSKADDKKLAALKQAEAAPFAPLILAWSLSTLRPWAPDGVPPALSAALTSAPFARRSRTTGR